ncbi:alpha amylase catalytic region [Kribbella flavida DSM 17836]|uniref:Alpha amylase catalytic region n=1 Tax=Kribbella flavida (strain DSM 17836 / JCM 10339 / NBRC 14399) TaxID=479435 RepID=D2PXV5_KRIFD|nr:alpha-amylase family glycosyl hydrolase [Kribbella flavida]ADB33561.1 alpha amylase catalytic region [Kribbella flavida DSM 17836]
MTCEDWWRDAVIYQIYPRSFQDTAGNGVGDLAGIIARLPYLSWLGVDALWMCPFYRSPQADFGYDITDHTAVDPLFGSLRDFDDLVKAAHQAGLRVIVDFVPNHTSIEHHWFVASRSSTASPYRDWYLWADPAPDGGPPNNWRSVTGGSAWTHDARTDQYYLHSFLPTQPDLNWRNPAVVKAMHDVLRFWLDRDVDGFRIDMVDYLIKDQQLRDEPLDNAGGYQPATASYQLNQPETIDLLRSFRALTDGYGHGRVLIGEVEYGLPMPRLTSYYGNDDALQLPINFWLLFLPWTAQALQRFITDYEAGLPAAAWPNWVIGSHDISRAASRLGAARVRSALLVLLTLRGTPFLYYGDELGLPDAELQARDKRDPWVQADASIGRDPARTPMPWTADLPHAGFCAAEAQPWLPIGSNHQGLDVETQLQDPGSTLHLTRDLLTLRRTHRALRAGSCQVGSLDIAGVLSYDREFNGARLRILVNCSDSTVTVSLAGARLLISTRRTTSLVNDSAILGPDEGCVIDLRPPS